MTWKTPRGERVLQGAEAHLFAAATTTMMDFARDGGEGLGYGYPFTKCPLFEDLNDKRKFTVLEEVAYALLKPTPVVPQLTAVREAAVYYIFRWLQDQFDPKCPEDGEEVWGKDILKAYDQLFPKEDDKEDDEEYSSRPKMGCLDCNRWAGAIEMIADQILWDRDFEMCDIFRNGNNSRLMAHARVEPDYFEPFEGRAKPGAEDRLYDLVYSMCVS